MSSSRVKWIVIYSTREFIDGRSHTSQWTKLFESADVITKKLLIERLQLLPPQISIGTPIMITENEMIDKRAIEFLWNKMFKILNKNNSDDIITIEEFALALKLLTKEEHGAMWSKFIEAMK